MQTHLNIMLDGLKKKAGALSDILNICENQQTVIDSEMPLDAIREMVYGMNEGKQEAIQIVRACDDMFENMLKDIGPELEAKQHLYAPQVKILQEHIRKVMDLDVKIRVTEEENNKKMDELRSAELPLQTTQTSQIAGSVQASGIKPRVTMPTDSAKVLRAYKKGQQDLKG